MNRKIPINLIQALRHELASIISNFKAYDVPRMSSRLGLEDGTEEEAFQSKYKYASRRLVALEPGQLVSAAQKLLEENCSFRLNELVEQIADFMAAYNFARRLKTLSGLTPYEYICKIWTSEPDRFILNPIHQMPGLNT